MCPLLARTVIAAARQFGSDRGYTGHVTGIVAGSSELPFANFSLFAYLGAFLWSSSFVLLGWYVGDEWQAVLERIQQHILTAVAILVGFGIAYLLVQRRRLG